jgi:hypothetical protein
MEDNVTITIEGEGLSLTKKTNLQKVGQIISFLGFNQELVATPSGTVAMQPQLPGASRMQPRDVIISSEAKTYAQKITALALYLRDEVGQPTFVPQEIRTYLKKMGDEPRNFTRDLNSALESQYIVCVDTSSEQYEITDRGVEAVEGKFAGAVTISKKNGTKRLPPVKGIREEVRDMQIVGSHDDLPDYSNLKTKADKILWLLAYADKNAVDSLTPAEVDHMSGMLRDRVNATGFTALNERNIKNAFVAKTKTGFQIQQKGLNYLNSVVVNEAT